MATTKAPAQRDNRNRVAVYVLAGLALLATAAVVFSFWGAPPQMGTDEEVFNTVDALYTAVRNRDEKQLAQCESRLKGYRDAGKLPEDAADKLDGIIAKARSGSWDTAAERLYDFMLAQKREGEIEHKPHKHPHPHPHRKGAK